MVIAETKRQMHETLEMKEDEVAQLRSRLQQATALKEELQEQKEKAEKAGEWNPLLNIHRKKKSFFSYVHECVFFFFPKRLKNLNGRWV